jgi:hypothetical protein
MAGILTHPWFTTDVPPGTLSMNDVFAARRVLGVQREQELREIVREVITSRIESQR